MPLRTDRHLSHIIVVGWAESVLIFLSSVKFIIISFYTYVISLAVCGKFVTFEPSHVVAKLPRLSSVCMCGWSYCRFGSCWENSEFVFFRVADKTYLSQLKLFYVDIPISQLKWLILLKLPENSLPSGSGHVHCGRDKMANVGVMKAKVPPWTIGSLQEYNVIIAVIMYPM